MSIEVEWARMTAPDLRELAARAGALAILPAGSLEQHGPHLPVITDTASASAGDPDPVPVAVLPGLWLGLSEHHLPFGGTISVDYAAYRAILESIVRSLRALGFARLLIVNGHGGNIDPLAVASRGLAVAYDFPIVVTTPWFLAPAKIAAIFESDTAPKHACEGETSVMMAIAGELVREHRLDEAMQQAPAPVQAPMFNRQSATTWPSKAISSPAPTIHRSTKRHAAHSARCPSTRAGDGRTSASSMLASSTASR